MKKDSIAIIGMSPWNSYFNHKTIQWLLGEIRMRFDGLRVMIPDHPAVYTYRALWAKKPASKARLKGNAIRNNIQRVLWTGNDVCIDWQRQINTHPAYKRSVKDLLRLSRTNPSFQLALEETTRDVLASKTPIDSDKIRTWTKFLICELAFLIAAKEILWGEVTYIYHRPWPIFTDLISWKFDGIKRDIDFEVISKEA